MSRCLLVIIVILGIKAEAQSSALVKGDSLFARGYYTKAIEAYISHENSKKTNAKVAKAYIALANYDKALEYFEQQLKLLPNEELLMLDYAKLLSKLKQYERASEVWHQLIDIDYKNPNYHYQAGLVLEFLKDSAAENRFYSAYQLDSTHQKAIFKMAKIYLKKRNYYQVDYYVDKGLESYAYNKALISLKAQNYFLKKDYPNAAKWFEKLIARNESSLYIHEKLSFCYTRMSEFQNAIEQCQLALKIEPTDVTNLYRLGVLYERVDDYQNAEKFILASLALSDRALDNEYMKLGYVYNLQGKHKDAIEAYTIATLENPENEDAHFYVVLTKDRYYKDIEIRLKLYENYKKKFPKSKFIVMVDKRISELKEENFLKRE
ncbi:MAG: tetratricopeptide repeat protein [Flavobacteriaceae bacterium]|nr:tetratricopeptide repeat protein [Flavobacteriaceae bacterium]